MDQKIPGTSTCVFVVAENCETQQSFLPLQLSNEESSLFTSLKKKSTNEKEKKSKSRIADNAVAGQSIAN